MDYNGVYNTLWLGWSKLFCFIQELQCVRTKVTGTGWSEVVSDVCVVFRRVYHQHPRSLFVLCKLEVWYSAKDLQMKDVFFFPHLSASHLLLEFTVIVRNIWLGKRHLPTVCRVEMSSNDLVFATGTFLILGSNYYFLCSLNYFRSKKDALLKQLIGPSWNCKIRWY